MIPNLTGLFRSLSPAAVALDLAKRQAKRYLAEGGTALSAHRTAEVKTEPADFVLPTDVDAEAVAKLVRAKLGMTEGDDPLQPFERRNLGGRVRMVLPGLHLLRLSDGRFDKGRAYMHRLVSDIRGRRGLHK